MTVAVERQVLPNRDHGLLKLVAILTMFVDHIGVVFFPRYILLRIIGRIAFPLFAYGIAVGVDHTRCWWRYALRLLVLALLSQWPYMMALNHRWYEFNVLITLLLGMLAAQGIKSKWYYSHIWAPAICLFLAAGFQMDYGWRGVILIILMYLCRNSRGGLAALMVSFCLYWGGGLIFYQDDYKFLVTTPLTFVNVAFSNLMGLLKLQSMAILALPLMLIPTNTGIRLPKWLSYLAYPGHLLLLYLFSLLLA